MRLRDPANLEAPLPASHHHEEPVSGPAGDEEGQEVRKREQKRIDRHIEDAVTTEALKNEEIARGMKRHSEELEDRRREDESEDAR